jgi:uncharacterized protein (TIGR03067 family)
MRCRWVWSVLLFGQLLAPSMKALEPPAKAAAADQDLIVGTWRITMLEIDGNRFPDADARKLLIVNEKDGNWAFKSEDQEQPISRGTSKFQPDKSPRQIDFTATDGAEAGVKFHGIYELSETNRRLCFAPLDFPRPTDFTSFPGTKRYLMSLERVATK